MLNFLDIPDELVLKIFSYPEAKDLISCGQVSKRIRRISRDSTLWVTANLEKKIVKTELLEMILGKGCRILNLRNSIILGNLISNIKSQLRVLKVSQPVSLFHFTCNKNCNCNVLEDLLISSCSLQHLEMEDLLLTTTMAENICENGKTLQILNLNSSDFESGVSASCYNSYLQEIIKCCQELKEFNLFNPFDYGNRMTVNNFKFLAENIAPNVEKLNLSHIPQDPVLLKILLKRCNKIKVLSLEETWINDLSLKNIGQCLNHTLEELSLGHCDNISFTGFLELKSMPRLKILNLYYQKDGGYSSGYINQYLRNHLPHVMIKVTMRWDD